MDNRVIGCFNTNSIERSNSSSGGVFVLLAKKVISSGGVVFAVKYDNNWNPIHYEINDISQLDAAMGAKYVQSKVGKTFCRIKELLEENSIVMFVGTPCQCAGLHSFLGKENENLITVELFCHGVPSRRVWEMYLDSLDKDNIVSLNMRDKSSGWSKYNYSWRIIYNTGKDEVINQREIPFMKGFVNDLYLRPSCYCCRFKGPDKKVDISLGDYWGVCIQPQLDDNNGTSLVIVYSQLGKELIESIEESLIFEETEYSRAIRNNPSFVSSSKLTSKRNSFYSKINAGESFESVIDELTREKNTLMVRVMNFVKKGMRFLLRRK